MVRNPQVLVQIQAAEAVMQDSGLRAYCLECIRDPERGGCCSPCDNLGPNGCIEKPLACALWLCDDARRKFPEEAAKLRNMAQAFPYKVSCGFRLDSLRAESQL